MNKLILALFIFCSKFLQSQVLFQNNHTEPVYVAIGYYVSTDEYNGWKTKGWYKIVPGQTKSLLSSLPDNRIIYYYAETKGGKKKFEGDCKFAVHPTNAFEIRNADMDYALKSNSAFRLKKFRIFEIPKGIFRLKTIIDIP